MPLPEGDQTGANAVEFVGFWIRLGAACFDLIIIAALVAPLVAVLVGEDIKTEHGGQMAGVLVVCVAIAYPLAFWLLAGRTPGKWLCSSRIVDYRTGGRPRTWQYLVRFLAYPASALPLMIGFLAVIWNPHRRGWHDRLARTAVVADESMRAATADEKNESRLAIHPPPW